MAIALLSAEEEHRAAPRTYSIPRRIVRERIGVGDVVKLLFYDDADEVIGVERMWVEVDAASGERCSGILMNQPLHLRGIGPGDRVAFGPEHVAAIDVAPDSDFSIDPAAFAVVSNRVWLEDAWPGRLERRAVPDPSFSGWYVLAGDEDTTSLDLHDFAPVTQYDLLRRFRVLDSGLEGPIGTVMRWDEATLEYVAG